MSFSNQKTKDTTLKTVVYKYWNINDTIHKIEKEHNKINIRGQASANSGAGYQPQAECV